MNCNVLQNSGALLDFEILTDRLLVRPYKEADFSQCIALYGDNEITKYFDHGKPRTQQETHNLLQKKSKNTIIRDDYCGIFSLFSIETGELVGQIDLVSLLNQPGKVEVGFILHKHVQGRGLATEAAEAIIFNHLAIRAKGLITHIVASVHPDNLPSIRVLEKLGMSQIKLDNRFGAPRLWYSMPLPLKASNGLTHDKF